MKFENISIIIITIINDQTPLCLTSINLVNFIFRFLLFFLYLRRVRYTDLHFHTGGEQFSLYTPFVII